jgi:tRNA(adenine34) deaminase
MHTELLPDRSTEVMKKEQDEQFMRIAIQQAQKGERVPGAGEVGAVLTKDGAVVCTAFNEGELQNDPTAHAEMVLIRRACGELKTSDLRGCTLYCTLQPCGMCTMGCLWAGISRIVYGAGRNDVNAIYFESRHSNTVDFIRDAFRDDLQVEGEVLAAECSVFYARKGARVPGKTDPAHEPTKQPS